MGRVCATIPSISILEFCAVVVLVASPVRMADRAGVTNSTDELCNNGAAEQNLLECPGLLYYANVHCGIVVFESSKEKRRQGYHGRDVAQTSKNTPSRPSCYDDGPRPVLSACVKRVKQT